MLKGKHIILGITGSIAAFKAPYLVRLLVKAGAEVRVVMTPAAHDFVTPLTLSTLSQQPVWTEAFDAIDGSWNSHVDIGTWADIMLIAPLTANTMGKMAHGIADNMLVTTYLSARCPVYIAPAMDLDMFKHPSTQANLDILQKHGCRLIEPAVGELASGLTGAGRMEEPEKIVGILVDDQKKKHRLEGLKAFVSAGPTYEPIDPVRFIGNRSSGRMGIAVADALAAMGAEVTLVCGPTAFAPSSDLIRIDVNTAAEMYEACKSAWEHADIGIMAAAVADFTPTHVSESKIKKDQGVIDSLQLKATKDILADLGLHKRKGQTLVGFALETDNEVANARQKLERKNLDMIVLNSLNDPGAGFGDTNKVTILYRQGTPLALPLQSKADTAAGIAGAIAEYLGR